MTIPGEPRAWLETYPLGHPVPVNCVHQGIVYPGQVVRAERWRPEYGEALTGEVYFRVALLARPRAGLRPDRRDSRIIVATPGDGARRAGGPLSAELATIRETQATYRVQRNPEAGLIRRALGRRAHQLEEQLLSQESARYASGEVFAGGQSPAAAPFFDGIDPAAWVERLAAYALAQAYPATPLNWTALPRPVVPAADAPRLWAALFDQPAADPDLLAQLGPGLRLPLAASLSDLSLAGHPVLSLLRQRWPGAPVAWAELRHHLAHEVGLTGPLATLCLLLWLYLERPPLALRLAPGHNLKLIGGAELPGSRLTAELLPLLPWPADLGRHALAFEPETPPEWNDALPMLSALAPELSAAGGDYRAQEELLLARAARLQEEIFAAKFVSAQLGGAGAPDGDTDWACLERLSSVAGRDFRAVYAALRRIYRDPRQLGADLEALEPLAQLARSADGIAAVWRYLGEAAVPPGLAELSVERQALQAALAPASLLRSARRWPALRQQLEGFKARYAAAYRAHHTSTQRELPGFLRDLESARRQRSALSLLNALPELGEPAGASALRDLEAIVPPRVCPAAAAELPLEEQPRCGACGLSLAYALPAAGLARLRAEFDVLLGDKSRQLSGLLVEKILQGKADQRLDDFLKIVQASDLTALVNTLNPDLLEFIRQLLP